MVFVDALKEGMGSNGLIESGDYVLDVRWAGGVDDRFPALARDVVERGARIIMVTTIAAVRAAQRATTTIPIGIANLTEDVTPKVLDILCAVIPKASVIAVLFNPANPSNRVMLEKIRKGSGAGATIRSFEFKPGALDSLHVATLALRHRIPVFSSIPELTDAGGLAGCGPPRLGLYRRSANYVKKILDGYLDTGNYLRVLNSYRMLALSRSCVRCAGRGVAAALHGASTWSPRSTWSSTFLTRSKRGGAWSSGSPRAAS